MPESNKKQKEKYEKYTLTQVASIFKSSSSNYNVELNPTNTVSGLIT
jgi:hypothetical protein